ncbi:hypothetical protein HMPREF0454_04316 [Hafnia alvei ATCC 51873]|uniref:Uncharacterized protein n=1 Tax=Hafnia alvei ATCC 51873 TaxID=1002364 RepID=G9YCH8_HAFAL|nr:hypothetical protein HMPREF0454_04316 [Hafnia alvei ATCC 51873]
MRDIWAYQTQHKFANALSCLIIKETNRNSNQLDYYTPPTLLFITCFIING